MNVTIIDIDNNTHFIAFKRFEYPSLMELIVNTYYSEIGECKGKALCGTCIVKVLKGHNDKALSKQEKHTLKVNDVSGKNFRLACQIMLDEDLDSSVFKIL